MFYQSINNQSIMLFDQVMIKLKIRTLLEYYFFWLYFVCVCACVNKVSFLNQKVLNFPYTDGQTMIIELLCYTITPNNAVAGSDILHTYILYTPPTCLNHKNKLRLKIVVWLVALKKEQKWFKGFVVYQGGYSTFFQKHLCLWQKYKFLL